MKRKRIVVGPPPNPEATPMPRSRQRTRAKLYKRSAQPPAMQLAGRDVEVLRALARHRFLSADQLRRLVFRCGASWARRRLRTLYDNRLIDRVCLVAQPVRGIPPLVYVLDRQGAAVLSEVDGPVRPGRLDGRRLQLVRHRYLVNDFFITLAEACHAAGYSLAEWRHEEDLLVTTKAGAQRAERISHSFLKEELSFLPDAYFELRPISTGRSLAFFLEVDLSTHPLKKWKERARLYAAYADPDAGMFKRRFGRENFRLLIVAPPPYRQRSRLRNILTTVRQELSEMHADSELFLGATLSDMTKERLFAPIWRTPEQDARLISMLPQVGVRPPSNVNRIFSDRVTVKS